MAGDWHKMRNDLRDDGRVRLIARRLNQPRVVALGCLHIAWAILNQFGKMHRDGTDAIVEGWSLLDLDDECGVQGFGAAMSEAGWLREDDDGLVFPDYEKHNSTTAKQRAVDASRKQSGRSSEKCPPKVGQNSDRTRTREEKRREEQNRPPTPQAAIAVPDGGGGGGESEAGDSEPKPRAPEVARILASVRSVAVRAELAALPDAVIVAAHELSAKVPKAHDRVAMMVAMARDGTAAGEVKARQRRAELDAEKRASDVARSEAERAEAERNRAESERTRVEAETSIDAASHLALKSAIRAAAERCPGKLRSELSAFVSLDPPIEALREQAKRRVIVRMVGEQLAGVARWNAG